MWRQANSCVALALCVLCSNQIAAAAELHLRTWTHREGARRAVAALESVDGRRLQLRTPSGKLAATTFDAISPSDQLYVRQWIASDRDVTSRPTTEPAKGLLGALPGIGGVLSKLAAATPDAPADVAAQNPLDGTDTDSTTDAFSQWLAPLLADETQALPAEMICVRISHDFLSDIVEQRIERDQRVRDSILGTSISGSAHTSGATRLVLHPDSRRALAEVIFTGTIHSRTVGYNGPVRLHSNAQTPFVARKYVTLGATGFQATPATSWAQTRSQTTHIDSSLPRLRGRIAQRVAWRRVGESRGQADAIASRHSEQQVNREFDATFNQQLAAIGAAVRSIEAMASAADTKAPKLHYSSTPQYMQLVARRQGATDADPIAMPAFDPKVDVAVRVHRAVIRQAATDSRMRQVIQPLLAGVLAQRAVTQVRTAMVNPATSDLRFNWSEDRQWLAIDFDGSLKELSSTLLAGRKGKLPSQAVVAHDFR